MNKETYHSMVENLSPPKFKFGDTVSTKVTGLPGIGKIVGVMPSIIHCQMVKMVSNNRWTALFPDWENEYVYTVYFDEPRRWCSYDEYIESLGTEAGLYKEEALQSGYDNMPQLCTMFYTEQDLELFE